MNLQERIEAALNRQKEDIIGEAALGSIRIVESSEQLRDINEYVDAEVLMRPQRREYAGEDVLYARESICQMLVRVEESLPEGYSLVLFDAYRPIAYQQMRFDQTLERIKAENPSFSDEEVRNEAFIYVFPPSWDAQTPPPHSTGGAIDLTVRTPTGELLDTGNVYGQFDDTAYTNAADITSAQRENRTFLLEKMLAVGFTNYPGEWWHFSYGDREWAVYEGKEKAFYGLASPERVEKTLESGWC